MVEWQPITEAALRKRIAQGVARMSAACRRLWEAVRVEPEKWALHPYGDAGGGFWVVAIIGRSVIWYNDIEEGFNRSRYSSHGRIDDYWRNDDELDVALAYLNNAIELGADLLRLRRPPERKGRK
ncbi:MAG TPA: hypothetical protein VN782_01735 [Usitatibacter sp.]|nr:hypothetical protein [Usitatibacter sp.]